jgi:hypothetical protein
LTKRTKGDKDKRGQIYFDKRTKGQKDKRTKGQKDKRTKGDRFIFTLVNAVSHGIIKTPMHGEETHAALGALHPVGHMGEIDDIANAVVYLDGAKFVTGEILHVDGGQSAGH